jgi:membrane protein YdbS with pleckstrin-like domain
MRDTPQDLEKADAVSLSIMISLVIVSTLAVTVYGYLLWPLISQKDVLGMLILVTAVVIFTVPCMIAVCDWRKDRQLRKEMAEGLDEKA